ncbi:MAG: hypothetical protein DLM61_00595, partial [Pseudonocardiales bacterium]
MQLAIVTPEDTGPRTIRLLNAVFLTTPHGAPALRLGGFGTACAAGAIGGGQHLVDAKSAPCL